MKKLEIKKGDRYGILTIIKELSPVLVPSGQNLRKILCLCDCGKKTEVYLSNLRKTTHTTSCGCVRIKRIIKFLKNGGHYVKHGKWGSPEYKSWNMMKQRCNNPNNMKYYLYGARGIEICERWNDFCNFYEDMGQRPFGTSIDRIDTTKGYKPGNCRWATIKEQNNNLSERKNKNPEMILLYHFKKDVKKRDNYKCKINNSDCRGQLEVHHILGWKDYPELRYDINNGITLCHFHHPRKKEEVSQLSLYFKDLINK